MSSRIPHLLEPYLSLPPEASLVLLTSVLGASTNWLVLRFLHSALINNDASSDLPPDEQTKVVLVSFMRDFAFWKENAKRLGLDLEKHAAKKRFSFVDGLSGLFLPSQQKTSVKTGEQVLTNPGLSAVSSMIQNSINNLKAAAGSGEKILLIIDQPDLLLAAVGEIGPTNLGDMLLGLREEAHALVVTLSADQPLTLTQQTCLETDHAAFLLSTAHQADFTMNLRLLDSGTARDVSGVVRVSIGEQELENDNLQKRIEERELLYFVGGDGGVKVFERGQ
ncbi:hypothetical protein HYALB_00011231 [Hymenoscyphus albidus]|uniref:Elongator complex protein 6 n=1 Tax=Hymenoscyphus albidus TaxID=595503 RepID=A0A9N9LGV6_9HELO|nr:hypothetical protein HYALB_00011231 [Hymenoscyphus albidus]